MKIPDFEQYVRVLRSLLSGEETDVSPAGRGAYTRFLNRRQGFVDLDHPIPVIVGANGPHALAVAGALGDGLITIAATRPDDVQTALGCVRAGASAAGRRLPDSYPVTSMTNVVVLGLGEPVTSERVARLTDSWVGAAIHFAYWGLDSEGELSGVWRRSGFDGLWFMGGNLILARAFSKALALQIRAIEDGAVPRHERDAQIATVPAPMATRRDLDETVSLVEQAGGRIAAFVADVRDLAGLRDALARGEEQLGHGADIVVANAGIFPVGGPEPDPDRTFRDVVEVNLTGTWNTISVTAPGLIERGRGGSIVLTSSTQGLVGRGGDGFGGLTGYAASKHGIVGLMRSAANWLAPYSIRVNSVHPTGVNTPADAGLTVR